ncbi:hypothetical protein [Paraburkholderia bonniea]|uniref:hypothetical protein n=2 Tax=Paraburkholderia bonniea TaxID=2152891 RepID=UPI001FE582BE|nr:hypothetical protein [Paraburkholderia bonniea]
MQIWDERGNVLFDTTTRAGRIRKMIHLNGTPGREPLDLAKSAGKPFWSFQPDFMFRHINHVTPIPIITLDEQGVTWRYSDVASGPSNPVTGWLLAGVF